MTVWVPLKTAREYRPNSLVVVRQVRLGGRLARILTPANGAPETESVTVPARVPTPPKPIAAWTAARASMVP